MKRLLVLLAATLLLAGALFLSACSESTAVVDDGLAAPPGPYGIHVTVFEPGPMPGMWIRSVGAGVSCGWLDNSPMDNDTTDSNGCCLLLEQDESPHSESGYDFWVRSAKGIYAAEGDVTMGDYGTSITLYLQ